MNNILTIKTMEEILREINKTSKIDASAIASRDGLLLCSIQCEPNKAEALAALLAAMVGSAEAAVAGLGKGVLESIIVESIDGKLIGTGAGPKALITVITGPDVSPGLILIEMKKASEKIKKVLG